jgi:hypothetical protein
MDTGPLLFELDFLSIITTMDTNPIQNKLLNLIMLGIAASTLSACGQPARQAAGDTLAPSPSPMIPLEIEGLEDLPDAARVSSKGGGPRTPSYWAIWNSCAPDNKADVAAANGGREAGWILLDDLLADPGIQVGDYLLESCQGSLSLLESREQNGEIQDEPAYQLAAQLLTAELNLSSGAETCPIAEEAVVGGHILLADMSFNGQGNYADVLSNETLEAISTILELLEAYNNGQLCQ